ncbi:MAG: peptidoglycan DD-metalloendopeptidase family protein [bacterium]|nr:peptidoglycan DD-metalloendopeptidase family protein [bacterium]
MQSNWQKNYKGLLVIGYWLLLSGVLPASAQSSVLDLNAQIQEKKQAQQKLAQQMSEYRAKILTTQKKAASLSNQINLLESNIAKTALEIKTKQLEAEQLALETQLVERQINEEEKRTRETLSDIARVLREVHKYDDRKYLEIVLAEHAFSEVFDQLFYTERLASNLKARLDTVKSIRDVLNSNRQSLTSKQEEAEKRKENLSVMQTSFAQEKRVKEALFGKTKSTEAEFRDLLEQLRGAASSIDSEIVTLEKNIRSKLDLADKLAGDTSIISWPVSSVGGISARFHDPEYPFRYLFEHGGVDIRAPQGSPVRAVASGYVAKAFNGGMGISPSYVMLIHGNQLSTVYMHLSVISIAANTYVARGDIIGRSGGAPRTPGAGRWTTGAHLHFETRLNGIPVDPMGYLP